MKHPKPLWGKITSTHIEALGILITLYISLLGYNSDFSVTVNPMSVSVCEGGTVMGELISVDSGMFYDKVIRLRAENQPPCIQVTFEPDELNQGGKSFVTVMVGQGTPAQTYIVPIVGIGADGKKHTCELDVIVRPTFKYDKYSGEYNGGSK